jgi:Raf kinase inhibitor-like YbhB/YbcL family protein
MRSPMLAAAVVLVAMPAFAAGFTVTSANVVNGAGLPQAQVCPRYGGGGHSPALAWSGEPAGTQSFAVTVFDPDAGGGFWHWTMFNIPAGVHHLAEGAGDPGAALPAGAADGANGAGRAGYFGACPPVGDPPHHYQITVYAVKVARLPLAAGAPPAEVAAQLRANAMASAQIVGLYGRAR